MLRRAKDLEGYRLHAIDGEIGSIRDFYFDDESWAIRYAVVNTGGWFDRKSVLIAPEVFGLPDWPVGELPVDLSIDQVRNSPPIEADKPVSRQKEAELRRYYDLAFYWDTGVMASGYVPMSIADAPRTEAEPGDIHLRSCVAVTGYHVKAQDGEVGHVSDFLIDDASWLIRYLVVDRRGGLRGKKALLAPDWVTAVDWETASVGVSVTRSAIRRAPIYDPAKPIGPDYETALHAYYGRALKWLASGAPQAG